MDNCSAIYKATMDPIAEENEMKIVNNVKASELFDMCDQESKGYVTANDLKQIIADVGLTEQQMEDAFNQLDRDKDGFITTEEFQAGFETFMQEISSDQNVNKDGVTKEEEEVVADHESDANGTCLSFLKFSDPSIWPTDGVEEFQLPKDNDLAGLLQDNLASQLWSQMQSQNNEFLPVFEEFLQNLATEHRRIREETSILHNSFSRKSQAYEQQIKVLYDEMEGQMQSERERLINKKAELETQLKSDLETLSEEKDKDVQELLEKLLQATNQLELASLTKVTTETENQQLLQEQELLKSQLDDYQNELQELRIQLEKAKSDSVNDNTKRFRSALRLSEKMAWEREALIKQLNLLRSINRRLQDERDEITNNDLKETESIENIFLLTSGDVYHPRLLRPDRGSIVGEYFPPFSRLSSTTSNEEKCDTESCTSLTISQDFTPKFTLTNPFLVDCIENGSGDLDSICIKDQTRDNLFLKMMNDLDVGGETSTYKNYADPELDALDSFLNDGQVLSPTENHEEEKVPTLCLVHPNNHQENASSSSHCNDVQLPTVTELKSLVRNTSADVLNNNSTPVIENRETTQFSVPIRDTSKIISINKNASAQQSVFKVIFIGDSGVGKTSIINRICGGFYSDTFCTTIGVDFRVKTVTVDGHQVVLQLWDTAGQERFRSITSQYMRRSDGVLILYDVNSEQSFRNVNSWLSTMENVNTDGVIVALIGNKIDLCSQFGTKAVATSDGMLAAANIDAAFFETSAKDYFGIEDMVHTMARKLRKKQLEDIESCTRLSSGSELLKVIPKKNSCC